MNRIAQGYICAGCGNERVVLLYDSGAETYRAPAGTTPGKRYCCPPYRIAARQLTFEDAA